MHREFQRCTEEIKWGGGKCVSLCYRIHLYRVIVIFSIYFPFPNVLIKDCFMHYQISCVLNQPKLRAALVVKLATLNTELRLDNQIQALLERQVPKAIILLVVSSHRSVPHSVAFLKMSCVSPAHLAPSSMPHLKICA